jgi:glycerol-3-phosphate dehydrogenase
LSPAVRRANLSKLAAERFDLLVIGGGINGAGIARDAVLRGLKVALIEKGDFASGTSSRSSKLIHGGLRYLELGDFRLVREASYERDRLRRRLAPHLVKPLPFLFPVYDGDPVGMLRLEVGMWIYDLLSAFRNIKMHRRLSRRRVAQIEPRLRQRGLKGAKLYYDCATDDARLTFETVLGASCEGAVVANYVRVLGFVKENGRLVGAKVCDERTGEELGIHARVVVNATGPWLDEIRRLDDPSAEPCLRLTKGVHIVVPRERVGNHLAVVLRAPRDQRILFVMPWDECTLIGTTDTDFFGSPDCVAVEADDVGYLLEAVNEFYPEAHLTPDDVVGSFAGLRPLVAGVGSLGPSQLSREEEILKSDSGLISLAGGKLTTFRAVAESVTDAVMATLNSRRRKRRQSLTKSLPLPGGAAIASAGATPSQTTERIIAVYGSRASELLALMQRDGALSGPIIAGMPYTKGEAVYAVEAEMAQEIEDILRRRTQMAVRDRKAAERAAQAIEPLIGPLLDSPDPSPNSKGGSRVRQRSQ